MIQLRIQP
jgi:hypothetical protein